MRRRGGVNLSIREDATEGQLCMRQVWDCAHGRDARPVEAPAARKSVGAEINYGVRLDGGVQAERFIDELAGARPLWTGRKDRRAHAELPVAASVLDAG